MTRRAAIIWVWGLVLIAGAVGGGYAWWRQQDVAQAYEAGRAAADADRWEEALTLAQPYAERDDPRINGLLADAYINGPDSIQDIDKGLTLRRLAAEAGDMRAAYFLGRWILEHEPTDAKGQEAIRYIKEAADCGMPAASYTLGVAYQRGLYVEQNLIRAVEYLESAALAGVKDAAWSTAIAYGHLLKGRLDTATVDDLRIIHWLIIAAENGHPDASSELKEITDSTIEFGGDEVSNVLAQAKEKAVQLAKKIRPMDRLSCAK